MRGLRIDLLDASGFLWKSRYSCNVQSYCIVETVTNLRSGIGTSNTALIQIPVGVKIYANEISTYSSDGYMWASVSYGGYTGWAVWMRLY